MQPVLIIALLLCWLRQWCFYDVMPRLSVISAYERLTRCLDGWAGWLMGCIAKYLSILCGSIIFLAVKAPPMVGLTWTRVHLTLGLDCFPMLLQGTALLLLPLHASFICLLAHVRCPMIQGCTSTSPPLLLICVHAPGGYTSWSCVRPLAW